MKVGDLVKNTHALDRCDLGLIVDIDIEALGDIRAGYLIRWCGPPGGVPEETWNSVRWLEKV